MIDLTLLRENPKEIIAQIKKKDPAFDGELLYDLDDDVRSVRQEVELLRHKKNELAKKGQVGITPELRQESITIGKRLKVKLIELEALEKQFHDLYLHCPNILTADVPEGDKEANKVVSAFGEKPSFDFPVKHHVELGEELGWFDFDAAAKITGSNFTFFKSEAARLIYALIRLMLKNNTEFGYELVMPSFLVNERSLEVASNFPKFKDQVYSIEKDKLYLTPTAEVNLANLYRDHIFEANQLPVRMTAWTSCFRREAGGYGATERGLIRIHQFDKVELFTICEPKDAQKEQEKMLACAEAILKKLDLHYRVSLLAAQDCSFPSARTFDIEVWLPGQKAYYEVSSVSNCTDFQARRGHIRYRKTSGAKPELAYTLNGSSLAVPRLLVAIMETYQQKDGTIIWPEALKKEPFI